MERIRFNRAKKLITLKTIFLFLLCGFIFFGFSKIKFTNQLNKDCKNGDSTIVKDIDGNIYNTVVIGNQVWMLENLKVSHYNDGLEIPNVKNGSLWDELQTGAYCDYDNNAENSKKYGKLYNWYAVNSGKLCPTGWHVPTRTDWNVLIHYLGGDSVAGLKMQIFNPRHTLISFDDFEPLPFNSSGFTALPGGKRQEQRFLWIEEGAYFWSSTQSCFNDGSCNLAHYLCMIFPRTHVNFDEIGGKHIGMSVRCIKNSE